MKQNQTLFKNKEQKGKLKILADSLVRSKIAASLGDKCLQFFVWKNQPKKYPGKMVSKGKFFVRHRKSGKHQQGVRAGVGETFPLQEVQAGAGETFPL